MQCTATLPGGSGQWNSCNTPSHCLGAVGSATPAMHCHTAWGQWAVQLLQCTATPPGGGWQWNSCHARAHQLGGRGVLPRRRSLPKERYSCNALLHCLGAVGSATPAMHCHTAWGQWAVQLLQCAGPPALPQRLGAVGNGTPAMRGPTSWGDGESCLGGNHCLKSGTRAMPCHTAWGQWAVELLQCTASLPRGSGQWNSCNARAHQQGGRGVLPRRQSLPKERYSCNALPHCLGAVGNGTPAMHCHTAWGQWAVELLQCAGPPVGGTGSLAQEAVAAQRAVLLQCPATLPGGSGQCSVVLCCVVLCCVVLCCVVLCCVVLCCVVLCCVVLCCVVFLVSCCAVLCLHVCGCVCALV